MWCGLEQNDHSEFMGVILAMEKLIMRQKKQSGEGNRKKKKKNSLQRQLVLPCGPRVEDRVSVAIFLTEGFLLMQLQFP